MHVYFEYIDVDLQNRIQLCTWKIYGTWCLWCLGSDGDRLGVPCHLFCNPVFPRKLEEECDCIEIV